MYKSGDVLEWVNSQGTVQEKWKIISMVSSETAMLECLSTNGGRVGTILPEYNVVRCEWRLAQPEVDIDGAW